MLVAVQFVGAAATPLNVTVLVPWVVPKLAPLIVTDVPTTPDVGFKLVMLGTGDELLTFTLTWLLVAELFDVSVATAVRMWFPLERVPVFTAIT
jgi:hypothetical protein